MTVLLEALPQGILCRTSSGHTTVDLDAGGLEGLKEIISLNPGARVAYLLLNGGKDVAIPISLLTPDSLSTVESSIRFLPELNGVLYRVARGLLEEFPSRMHVLLCDTAFFSALPPEASAYAIPYNLYSEGIRRYGGFGLCHQWAWQRALTLTKRPIHSMISVYLGDRTNVCAIRDGLPIDISFGFTPIEGIPSLRSCGDIDPTLVFLLLSDGMTFSEINRILSMESGFSTILGSQCTFKDIVADPTYPADASAERIFIYDVLRYVGGYVPLLNGVDAVVFESHDPPGTFPLISDLCLRLRFLGISCKAAPPQDSAFCDLTAEDSTAVVLSLKYDKWEMLEGMAASFSG